MQAARSAYSLFRMSGYFASSSTRTQPTHFHPILLAARSISQSPLRAAAMPSSWGGLQRVAQMLAKRPLSAVFGVTVVSGGLWAAQAEWRSRHRHFASTGGPLVTSAQASSSAGMGDATARAEGEGVLLRLMAGAAIIPHPAKEDKGGEDAYFICERGHCLGVADGVGGWAEIGVDPGLYSSELMEFAKEAASGSEPGPAVPQQVLEAAHTSTTARGSSTACIVCVHAGHLHASNLGDSGFMVVRAGELAFMSPQQQHEFNFPYQIGSADSMADTPAAAQRFSMRVQPGDIVVLATDGLFDNVYPDEAAALVALAQSSGETPAIAAASLAQFARGRAADPTHLSPFAYGAQQLGYRYFGGKMDDITVVCAYVEVHDEPQSRL